MGGAGSRYSNGRIPARELVRLDSGNGEHVLTLPTAFRWYAFRLDVYLETGVWLYITPGKNGYRDEQTQIDTRNWACSIGNCNQAAVPRTSSHGGTWRGRDAMAIDVGNYWAIPWAVFKRLAEKWGFLVGAITKAVAGIDEPWHIIDLAPYDLPPEPLRRDLRMVKGSDSIWRLERLGSLAGGNAQPLPLEDTLSRAEVDEIKRHISDEAEETRRYAAGVPGNGAFPRGFGESTTTHDRFSFWANGRGDLFWVRLTKDQAAQLGDDVQLMTSDQIRAWGKEWPFDPRRHLPGTEIGHGSSQRFPDNWYVIYEDDLGFQSRKLVKDPAERERIAELYGGNPTPMSQPELWTCGPINQPMP